MTTYRERRERRAARREEWAEKRDEKAKGRFGAADQLAKRFDFGQPILVGHHSEKGARRDQEKIHGNMRQGVEDQKVASRHREAADTIRGQLDRSVYSDDHDAIARLQSRIDEREARRTRIKEINRAAGKVCRELGIKRTGHYEHMGPVAAAAKASIELCKRTEASPDEVSDIAEGLQYNGTVGYPSYVLTNLGGNIRRDKKRLARLSPTPTKE